MTSQIDPTVPAEGTPTTASVRGNFATAQQEISSLQTAAQGAPFLPIAGGQMGGVITLYNDPTGPMQPVTLGYFQANGGGGGGPGTGGVPEAPADGTLYGRQSGAWLHAVNTTELNNAISTALATIPPEAPSDGNTYGRMNKTWSPAVTTSQMNAAISAAAYPDAPNDGNPYLRLSGAWKYGVPQLGSASGVAVVDHTTGSDKSPTIGGVLTPVNPTSDQLILAARRLATPASGGLNSDGAVIAISGPSAGLPNSVTVNTGNNAAGYKTATFGTDGSLTLASGSAMTSDSVLSRNGVFYGRTTQNYLNFSNNSWSFVTAGGNICNLDSSGNLAVSARILCATGIVSQSFGVHAFGWAWSGGGAGQGITAFVDSSNEGLIVRSPGGLGYTVIDQQGLNGNTSQVVWGYPGGQVAVTVTFSDRRLKSNVKPADVDAIGLIDAIEVYDADVRNPLPEGETQHWDCSLIAEQLGEVIPQARIKASGEEGTYDSVNAYPIVCTLVRAFQQMTARIAALEAKLGV